MAKGWQAIQEQSEALQAQREQGGNFLPELRVNAKNPGPYIIRFLEQGQEVNNFPVHEYKEVQGGNTYHKRFTCLKEVGQPCPGCQAGMKEKRRGVYNVIQRGRAVLRKDKDGKALKDGAGNYIPDGWRDEVVVANVGGPTAEMLRKADGDYHGLMCRDFQVTYSGETFQAWDLKVVMDASGSSSPTPMSEADMVLAANKHDLDAYMKPPTFQEAAQIIARYGGNSGVQTQQPAPPQAPAAAGFLAGVDPTLLPDGGAFAAATQQQSGVPAPAQPPTTPPAS